METRQELLRRPDVPNEDVDDIIGIAQELQDTERADRQSASVDEVRAVAAELEIDPAYVERAIEVLHSRRQDVARAEAERAAADAEQARTTRRAMMLGGATVLGVLVIGGIGVAGVSAMNTGAVSAAQVDLDQAEGNLDVVLQRQASLVPQLIALAGGDVAGLQAHISAVKNGATMADRLEASDMLGAALSKSLASLPPATDEATTQQRLNLQHELSGAQNRITVERRRYEEARLAFEQASGR